MFGGVLPTILDFINAGEREGGGESVRERETDRQNITLPVGFTPSA